MATKRKRRTNQRSNRRILGLAVLFILGSVVLMRLLQMGVDLAGPYDYKEYIEQYSEEYRLDRSLVAAVIYQESRYDPEAVSKVGARGLMQIMPDTARWIAEKLDLKYSKEKLFDPELNIRMGSYYLSYLLKRYDGNVRTALAAYNAGPGSVDKWLKDPDYSDGGELTKIPFAETRKYVEKVLEMQKVYRKMLGNELSGDAK